LSSCLARPATSDRGAADLKASPLPLAPFDSCGLAGYWSAGLQLAGRLAGWLAFWLACLLAFWEDQQDWQGAWPK